MCDECHDRLFPPSKPMEKPTCSTCVYWDKEGNHYPVDASVGRREAYSKSQCRKHPKSIDSYGTNFCGDHPLFPKWMESEWSR